MRMGGNNRIYASEIRISHKEFVYKPYLTIHLKISLPKKTSTPIRGICLVSNTPLNALRKGQEPCTRIVLVHASKDLTAKQDHQTKKPHTKVWFRPGLLSSFVLDQGFDKIS
jgi:hypothetical protein